jgi:hypothetical protein
MRIREGVTAAVNEKMEAVQANVLREDGLLLRTCTHGVRHPVGDIHSGKVSWAIVDLHRQGGCCAHLCCHLWSMSAESGG